MSERFLDGLAHLCALVGVAFSARAATIARGWLRVPVVATLPHAPALSVVVPARNEARSIERCVRSLLAQTIDAEVIVVDDRSEDETPAILERLACEDARLRVVRGAPLPPDWAGKPWALAQGARTARGAWLLFTDADTWHAPEACASALAFVLARDVDALSLATYQELGSLAERAVLPAILGLILIASGPLEAINDPASPEHALANGQYLLIARPAYDALGGHEALRGELVEDVEFARRLKADGRYRLLVAGGEELVRVRMYRSLPEIWDGFTKNMYAGARGDLRALAGAAVMLSALSVVPAALSVDAIVRGRPVRACEALLTLLNGAAVAASGFRYTRLPRRLAWWAPVGYAFCAAVVLNSTLRVLGGRGVEWRGRRYTGRFGADRP